MKSRVCALNFAEMSTELDAREDSGAASQIRFSRRNSAGFFGLNPFALSHHWKGSTRPGHFFHSGIRGLLTELYFPRAFCDTDPFATT